MLGDVSPRARVRKKLRPRVGPIVESNEFDDQVDLTIAREKSCIDYIVGLEIRLQALQVGERKGRVPGC